MRLRFAVTDSEQSLFPCLLCSAELWFDVLDSMCTHIVFKTTLPGLFIVIKSFTYQTVCTEKGISVAL